MKKFLYFTIIFSLTFFFFSTLDVKAANPGTIDPTYNTAKLVIPDGIGGVTLNSSGGTLYFNCDHCNISVDNDKITGFAWGDYISWINFNPDHGGVFNTTSGVLSGFAWGQNVGWINFNPDHGGVTIDINTGEFNGYAWAQNYGWIKFDCSSDGKIAGECVTTDWRPVAGPTPNIGGYSGGVVYCNNGATNYPACDAMPPAHICTPGIDCADLCTNVAGDDKGLAPVGYDYVSSSLGCLPFLIEKLPPPASGIVGFDASLVLPPETLPPPPTSGVAGLNTQSTLSSEVSLPAPTVGVAGLSALTSSGSVSTNASLPVGGTTADCTKNPNSLNCKIDTFTAPVLSLLSPVALQRVTTVVKVAAAASVVVGVAVVATSTAVLAPIAAAEATAAPFRIWSLLLTALGLKRKVVPWGTVYDSVTKQPLDPAYLSLINMKGKEVTTCITDIDGRYGFFAPPGEYKVVPKKTNYIFPSKILSGQFKDELYQDLYFGDSVQIKEGQVIVKNIPLDPLNFDWNEFAKNKHNLFRFYSKRELFFARVLNWVFGFGFTVSIISFLISHEIYNALFAVLFLAMFLIRNTSFMQRARGKILDRNTGLPLSFGIIRVVSAETGVEIKHGVADHMGRYYVIVPNGTYFAKIDKKNNDGSYTTIFTSDKFSVTRGTLNQAFNV